MYTININLPNALSVPPHILTPCPRSTYSTTSTTSTTRTASTACQQVLQRHTTHFNMTVDHAFVEEMLAPLKTNGILGLTQSMPDDTEFIMVNPNPEVDGVPGSGPKDVSGREPHQCTLPHTPFLDLPYLHCRARASRASHACRSSSAESRRKPG
jgi:hypothetical protein